ncbi:chymotrypsin-2-like [Anoplolepis gracilipes]|uniref:chymotrypsin-2-like n=1 Tax=Anoplolepis gracilipes TaxID=354296 RepID=UPI003B9F9FD0
MLRLTWILIFIAASGINAEEADNNDGDVDINQYPYLVLIKKNGIPVCSGAILDKHHVITSDRCVPPFEHIWNIMNNIVVVCGTSSLKPSGKSIFVKEMFSQNHYANPLNNPVTSGLGVLKLQHAFKFDENVQPIQLFETEVPLNTKLQMVGWMVADREGKKTAHLKKVTLNTISRQECQPFHKKKLSNEFCTRPEPNSQFCQGNSGSPLIYKGKLVGVATYGISCNVTAVPDVHASIDEESREYLQTILNE